MAVHTCKQCGKMRAKSPEQLCNVCWLLNELKREHDEGDHKERMNPSCVACTTSNDRNTSDNVSDVERTRERRSEGSKRGSHANCSHEATPAARARCRRRRQKM